MPTGSGSRRTRAARQRRSSWLSSPEAEGPRAPRARRCPRADDRGDRRRQRRGPRTGVADGMPQACRTVCASTPIASPPSRKPCAMWRAFPTRSVRWSAARPWPTGFADPPGAGAHGGRGHDLRGPSNVTVDAAALGLKVRQCGHPAWRVRGGEQRMSRWSRCCARVRQTSASPTQWPPRGRARSPCAPRDGPGRSTC